MKVIWTRGNENISFREASIWYTLGIRGSGKSTFLEHVGMNYSANGAVIFDLWGSKDAEGVAWLRSDFAKDKKILLVKSENVDVQGSYETRNADALTLHDFETYDLLLSVSPFYLNFDQEFYYTGKIMDLMYKRLAYKRLVFVICREAANLYFSRLKICDDQTLAKAQCAYLLRESRHMGLAMGLDSTKFTSIESDIRALMDYLVIKSQGMLGLSDDLKWLYSFFNSAIIRKMPQQYFCIVSKNGGLGLGEFPYHDWHKRIRENILEAVGLKVEPHGEAVKEAEDKGTFKTVGDKEHLEIVRLLIEENLGMVQIGEQMGRSSKTISDHLRFHNRAVELHHFCPRCKRANGIYADKKAERQYLDKKKPEIPI